jgi:hypothetical protein
MASAAPFGMLLPVANGDRFECRHKAGSSPGGQARRWDVDPPEPARPDSKWQGARFWVRSSDGRRVTTVGVPDRRADALERR